MIKQKFFEAISTPHLCFLQASLNESSNFFEHFTMEEMFEDSFRDTLSDYVVALDGVKQQIQEELNKRGFGAEDFLQKALLLRMLVEQDHQEEGYSDDDDEDEVPEINVAAIAGAIA